MVQGLGIKILLYSGFFFFPGVLTEPYSNTARPGANETCGLLGPFLTRGNDVFLPRRCSSLGLRYADPEWAALVFGLAVFVPCGGAVP